MGAIEPVVLILLAPFVLFVTPARSVFLLAIPAVWVGRWYFTRHPSPAGRHFISRTPLDVALLLLAVMVLVSEWATYDIAVSLPKIAGMVFGLGVFYAVVRSLRTTRAWLVGLSLFALLGSGVAVLGLLGTDWIPKFGFLRSIIAMFPTRLTGLSGAAEGFHPNEVAGTLLWVAPLMLAFSLTAIHQRRKLRLALGPWLTTGLLVLLSGAALLTLAVLVLTQSRSGLLGLGFGLLAMLVLAGRKTRAWLLTSLVAVVLAATAALIFIGPERLTTMALGPRLDSTEALSLDTLDERLEFWSRAIYAIQDFPLTGMGMNTFRTVVTVLYPLSLVGPEFDIGHAHNTWLQTALDLGLPGLVAYLAVWLITVKMLWDVVSSLTDPLLRGASVGLLGSLAAFFVYGLTDTVALGARPGFLWWILLGLAAATWRLALAGGE